jgi:hypothetical protein
MPIISQIGRKHPRVRALYLGIYLVLILGAVTMLFPFLVMVAGSTKSAVDLKDLTPVPRFLYDDLALYRKHIEGLFNESLDAMNIAYDSDAPSFEALNPPDDPHLKLACSICAASGTRPTKEASLSVVGPVPDRAQPVPANQRLVDEWLLFLKESNLPGGYCGCGYIFTP